MKKSLSLLGAVVLFVVSVLFVATAPGEIHAVVGPDADYVAMLQAKADRTGRQLVWVGQGVITKINGTDLAMLPYSAPILFDKADVGRPFDKLRNRQTRREVRAALKSQETLAAIEGPAARNLRMATALSDFEKTMAAGEEKLPMVARSEVAAEADPLPVAPDCQYGDPECAGCYTDLGTIYGVRWCGYACITCRVKSP